MYVRTGLFMLVCFWSPLLLMGSLLYAAGRLIVLLAQLAWARGQWVVNRTYGSRPSLPGSRGAYGEFHPRSFQRPCSAFDTTPGRGWGSSDGCGRSRFAEFCRSSTASRSITPTIRCSAGPHAVTDKASTSLAASCPIVPTRTAWYSPTPDRGIAYRVISSATGHADSRGRITRSVRGRLAGWCRVVSRSAPRWCRPAVLR